MNEESSAPGSSADQEWEQLWPTPVDDGLIEVLRTERTVAEHIARQFQNQGKAEDPCAEQVQRYKDAQAEVNDKRHSYFEARLVANSAHQQVTIDRLTKRLCTTNACRHQADVYIARDSAAANELDQAAGQAKADYEASKVTRDAAIGGLRECRQQHPYEHECGERGGPGIRRPDGRCYSWEELQRG
jgi:hypothetical protein